MRSCLKTDVRLVRKGWARLDGGETSVWVRGQAHLGNEYLDAKALAERFAKVALDGAVGGLDELTSSLNGNWAAVVKSGEWVYLATDHLRSIQILYRVEGEVFHVFDDM